jgi:hypothetical protein
MKRMQALKPIIRWAGELWAALQAGQLGPGWTRRYPYYHNSEAWLEVLEWQAKMPPKKFRLQVADFAARYPQLVLMAEKLIVEEDQPEARIMILATLARLRRMPPYAVLV